MKTTVTILIVACFLVLTTGCATTNHFEKANAGQYWSGACDSCGRVFSFPNPTKEPRLKAEDWGLQLGMTRSDVEAIMGKPSDVVDDYHFIYWYYSGNKKLTFFKYDMKDRQEDFKLHACEQPLSPDQVVSQDAISCPYCGKVQSRNKANDRYIAGEQAKDQKGSAQNMMIGQAVVGLATGLLVESFEPQQSAVNPSAPALTPSGGVALPVASQSKAMVAVDAYHYKNPDPYDKGGEGASRRMKAWMPDEAKRIDKEIADNNTKYLVQEYLKESR